MIKDIVVTKSVAALRVSHEELLERADGLPAVLLVSGASGAGKTTALRWLAQKTGAIYVRALATDSAVAFLSRLTNACGMAANSTRGNSVMTEMIGTYLQEQDKTLIVDEGDFLFSSQRLIESLRDIHDLSGQPVLIAGHTGIERRFANRPQLFRRISTWMQFHPCDLEDMQLLAKRLCKVSVDDDLLQHLQRECHGNPGLARVGLSQIEKKTLAAGKRRMNLDDWGRRKFYLTHQVQVAA